LNKVDTPIFRKKLVSELPDFFQRQICLKKKRELTGVVAFGLEHISLSRRS